MYDGLEKIPINKLNFNQLRERMQILQDRYEMLLRRYPELSVIGSTSEGEGIDWANIKTPLINAIVNKIKLKASQNYDDMVELDHEPGKNEDKSKIYFYDDLYWYWNGNEWACTDEKNIYSIFQQTPAGFLMQGVLELLTPTNGRLTISDSFIKMYPEGKDESGNPNGNPTYEPKLQMGYDSGSENSNPVILFGTGAPHINEETGEAEFATKEIMGYPVRYEQAVMIKTAQSIAVGMVGDWGNVQYIELKAYANQGEEEAAGLYYYDGDKKHRIVTDVDITGLQMQIEQLQQQVNELKNKGE